jgi:hypothetical protein
LHAGTQGWSLAAAENSFTGSLMLLKNSATPIFKRNKLLVFKKLLIDLIAFLFHFSYQDPY